MGNASESQVPTDKEISPKKLGVQETEIINDTERTFSGLKKYSSIYTFLKTQRLRTLMFMKSLMHPCGSEPDKFDVPMASSAVTSTSKLGPQNAKARARARLNYVKIFWRNFEVYLTPAWRNSGQFYVKQTATERQTDGGAWGTPPGPQGAVATSTPWRHRAAASAGALSGPPVQIFSSRFVLSCLTFKVKGVQGKGETQRRKFAAVVHVIHYKSLSRHEISQR